MYSKKVAVIGGGAAGLCAARHCTAPIGVGGGVTVFEQTSQLGGTWVYTDEIDTDRFGLPIHTSMYKNLRTNLPKEVMGFPDFPITGREESYIPGKEILSFLNKYADEFDLKKYIKFNHLVTKVSPKSGMWEVEVRNLVNNEILVELFDGVMVCSGHYHTPLYPEIDGSESFPGLQIHSHYYREPEKFKGKSILVIGGGPSGLDIALDTSYFAEKVIISHHLPVELKTKFPSNITQRPDVKKIKNNMIYFVDGSEDEVDTILYCTGYHYNFPFLSKECNVVVENNFVQPLFKHLIHIYHPTLCFIGIPYYVCHFIMFDLQVRVYLKLLSGEISLPSQKEMLADVENEIKWRQEKGLKKKQFHMMGTLQGTYYDDLTKFAKLPSIPSVYVKLHNESSDRFNDDLINFRKDVYRIVDDENFLQIK